MNTRTAFHEIAIYFLAMAVIGESKKSKRNTVLTALNKYLRAKEIVLTWRPENDINNPFKV